MGWFVGLVIAISTGKTLGRFWIVPAIQGMTRG
jgi:hypothetical protein